MFLGPIDELRDATTGVPAINIGNDGSIEELRSSDVVLVHRFEYLPKLLYPRLYDYIRVKRAVTWDENRRVRSQLFEPSGAR